MVHTRVFVSYVKLTEPLCNLFHVCCDFRIVPCFSGCGSGWCWLPVILIIAYDAVSCTLLKEGYETARRANTISGYAVTVVPLIAIVVFPARPLLVFVTGYIHCDILLPAVGGIGMDRKQ